MPEMHVRKFTAKLENFAKYYADTKSRVDYSEIGMITGHLSLRNNTSSSKRASARTCQRGRYRTRASWTRTAPMLADGHIGLSR